jgi:hypothetical protein
MPASEPDQSRCWVKLVRSGNSVSGYVSADGNTWSQVGASQTLVMTGAIYAGLAVTAHNNSGLCMATFDNVKVWSANGPQIALARSGANLILSWPLANTGFVMQLRTNLALGSWLKVTSPAAQIVSNRWQVILPASGDPQSVFYRLSE